MMEPMDLIKAQLKIAGEVVERKENAVPSKEIQFPERESQTKHDQWARGG